MRGDDPAAGTARPEHQRFMKECRACASVRENGFDVASEDHFGKFVEVLDVH